MKYKNTVLMLVSLLFFAYAALISIVPSAKTSSFNTDEFEKKFEEATSLVTTVDSVRYEITPSLKTKIRVRNLSLKYVDYREWNSIGICICNILIVISALWGLLNWIGWVPKKMDLINWLSNWLYNKIATWFDK